MNTPRDRDQSLDQWLRQAFPETSPATDACLDAETAAAWADGALPPTALAQAQRHVAYCARCQALVGELLRVESAAPTLQPQPAERPWRRWLTWAVPLAAAATAVIAVFVWLETPQPERRTADFGSTRETPAAIADEPQLRGENPRKPTTGSVAGPGQAELAEVPPAVNRRAPAAAPAGPAASPGMAALGRTADAAVTLTSPSAQESERSRRAGEIVSPDPAFRWRLTGNSVQRSIDGGSTWSAGAASASDALNAGSAPTPTVCWVVGGAGTVLRTLDGVTWTRIAFPERADLAAVRATDASTASVTTADGRVFTTADGGARWALAGGP